MNKIDTYLLDWTLFVKLLNSEIHEVGCFWYWGCCKTFWNFIIIVTWFNKERLTSISKFHV